MKTSARIPLSIQPEVCKQRWEIGKKKKKFREMNWVWAEPLPFGIASALVQGRAGLTSTSPIPFPTPPNQDPMSFLLCGQQIWPSVELVSWHLISPLPGQMASEITEGDRMSRPVYLHPVTCTSLWKYWANDKGELSEVYKHTWSCPRRQPSASVLVCDASARLASGEHGLLW